MEILKDVGVVDVVSKKGNPPKRYIKINEDAILKLFNFQKLKNLTFESEKTELLKVKKLNTNKNISKKKEEKDINNLIEKTGFLTNEFATALNDFLEMRKKIRKPATDRAVALLLDKVVKLSNGNEGVAIQILNQSTVNSWLGVYPLKNNYSYSGGKQTRNEFMDMLKGTEVSDFDEDRSNSDFGFTESGISEYPN